MKNFKFHQIKTVLILSVLILVFHFIILLIGNYPGGSYGMAPFAVAYVLFILLIFTILVLFFLSLFKINISSQKTALLFIVFYLIFLLFSGGFYDYRGNFDYSAVELFVYPPVISLLSYWSISFLIEAN